LKLADFGFIKRLDSTNKRTYTFCGTPEYIAPEIISGEGYGFSVDWYALGIIIYEMFAGHPPFMAHDVMDIFKKTKEEKMKFPRGIDDNAKSLIKKLCAHDLAKRYGNIKGGV
jgi:serine/threonine protein kinase